jgi:diamine N-acetyltransferase
MPGHRLWCHLSERIIVEEVTRANWRETLALAVAPEQQRFVANIAPIAALGLAKAYIRPGGLIWTPYAFTAQESDARQMVGFAMLATAPESADNVYLLHFFIDLRFQRRGYGAEALRSLIGVAQTKYPQSHAMTLTVHPENIRAQRARYAMMSPSFGLTGSERVCGRYAQNAQSVDGPTARCYNLSRGAVGHDEVRGSLLGAETRRRQV